MRKYLTPTEVGRLLKATSSVRDRAMVLLAFRHGFRVSELVNLLWQDIDLDAGLIHVSRLKRGRSSVHPLQQDEIELLRSLRRSENGRKSGKPDQDVARQHEHRSESSSWRKSSGNHSAPAIYVFLAKHGGPMSANAFYRYFRDLGPKANIPFPTHPHQLRHATGFKLANDGVDTRALQAYLGHRNIQHTVVYTELSPNRFKNFWSEPTGERYENHQS